MDGYVARACRPRTISTGWERVDDAKSRWKGRKGELEGGRVSEDGRWKMKGASCRPELELALAGLKRDKLSKRESIQVITGLPGSLELECWNGTMYVIACNGIKWYGGSEDGPPGVGSSLRRVSGEGWKHAAC